MRSTRKSETIQFVAAIACILATGLLPDMLGSGYWSYSFQFVNILIAVAVAQNFLLQDANQVSFGQGAIFGAGAYAAAMALSLYGLPWIVAFLCATAAGALAGLIYALPALRVQGYYLGFVTLSAAMVFPELLFTFDSYTNGINGISTPAGAWKQPLVAGLTPLSLACALAACAAVAGHLLLRRSPAGRLVRVAGASPESAQTLGLRPGLIRSVVFCGTCAATGAAGALYPPIVGFVSPAAFHLELSVLIFLSVIVGGRGQVFGPLAGIYLLYLLPNVLLVDLIDYRLLAYGTLALLVMLVLPDGIVGSFDRRLRRRAKAQELDFGLATLPLPAGSPRAGEVAISIRDASKSFGAVRAIDNVSVEVPAGRIVGLVGANGSGKTSLINAITGFSRLDKGAISVFGQPIAGKSPSMIARMGIGRTFQTPRIFDTLSAFENVSVGAEARGIGTGGDASLEQLRAQLAGADIDIIPHGQRRSIEVLRVLQTGAEIILLDEPAAGLSHAEREGLQTLLLRLRNEAGRTIVIVEHDLNLVWRVADEVVVMESGRVIASGAPAEVARNPQVSKLFVSVSHA